MITSFQNTHRQAPSLLSPFDVSALWDLQESRPFHRLKGPFSIPLPPFHLTPSLPSPIGNFNSLPLLEIHLFVLIWRKDVHTADIQGGCISYPSTPPPPDIPQLLVLGRHLYQSYRVSMALGSALERNID